MNFYVDGDFMFTVLNAVNFSFFTCLILGWKRHGLGRNTLIEIIGRAQDETANDDIQP